LENTEASTETTDLSRERAEPPFPAELLSNKELSMLQSFTLYTLDVSLLLCLLMLPPLCALKASDVFLGAFGAVAYLW